MVHAKDPPAHYLTKLRTYLDPKASRSHRVSKTDDVSHQGGCNRELVMVGWRMENGRIALQHRFHIFLLRGVI